MDRTPTLWSFVGIYFNQDWPEDYGSEDASVGAFISEAPDDRMTLVVEIEWVLAAYDSEEKLAAYLDDQGSEHMPPSDRGGYRGWLTRIADKVRA